MRHTLPLHLLTLKPETRSFIRSVPDLKAYSGRTTAVVLNLSYRPPSLFLFVLSNIATLLATSVLKGEVCRVGGKAGICRLSGGALGVSQSGSFHSTSSSIVSAQFGRQPPSLRSRASLSTPYAYIRILALLALTLKMEALNTSETSSTLLRSCCKDARTESTCDKTAHHSSI